MKKKWQILTIAWIYCTVLFLLPTEADALFFIITAAGSVLYGGLLPFFSCGSWIFAFILSAVFCEGLAVRWMLSPEPDRDTVIIFAILMLAAAVFARMIRKNGKLRFERVHLPRKIAGGVILLATLIFVFFIWSGYRPEGLMSMEMDSYHFNFILFYYPIFSLLYGIALPIFVCGDRAFTTTFAVLFILICTAGLQITGMVSPIMTVFYAGIVSVGILIGEFLEHIFFFVSTKNGMFIKK